MRFTVIKKVDNVYDNNRYMLYLPETSLPPFFGTKNECKKAQITCENEVEDIWTKATYEDKKSWLNSLPPELLVRFTAETPKEELFMLGIY